MDLPGQNLSAGLQVDKAIEIVLPANSSVLIQYLFRSTIHQNLLVLSLLDISNQRYDHYRLATWTDTTQVHVLANTSAALQVWYLSGWECCQFTATLDNPNAQLDKGADLDDPNNHNKEQFMVACQIPGPLHRGDWVSRVEVSKLTITLWLKSSPPTVS